MLEHVLLRSSVLLKRFLWLDASSYYQQSGNGVGWIGEPKTEDKIKFACLNEPILMFLTSDIKFLLKSTKERIRDKKQSFLPPAS